jgi:hypothetical protein
MALNNGEISRFSVRATLSRLHFAFGYLSAVDDAEGDWALKNEGNSARAISTERTVDIVVELLWLRVVIVSYRFVVRIQRSGN